MATEALATLKALLDTPNAAASDPAVLERFLQHLTRRPLVLNGRRVPLALSTFLVRWPHLRPAVQTTVEAFIHTQWRRMDAEASQAPGAEAQAAPETPSEPDMPAEDPLPGFTAPPATEDWFDRFLDGVRALLFL